jgi:hypothetical protein
MGITLTSDPFLYISLEGSGVQKKVHRLGCWEAGMLEGCTACKLQGFLASQFYRLPAYLHFRLVFFRPGLSSGGSDGSFCGLIRQAHIEVVSNPI